MSASTLSIGSAALLAFLGVLMRFGGSGSARVAGDPCIQLHRRQVGAAGSVWQGLLASACLIPAVSACLVVPNFLVVLGPASLRASLYSAARHLDIPLVGVACLGICLARFKTRLLLETGLRLNPSRAAIRIAADSGATAAVIVAMAGLYAFAMFFVTGDGRAAYLPGQGVLPILPYLRESMADLIRNRGVHSAILCLPLADSGSFWAYAAAQALAAHHVTLIAAGSCAAATACWITLFLQP